MSIADHTTYSANLARAQRYGFMTNAATFTAGQLLLSLFRTSAFVLPAVPSTAVTLDNTSVGALGQVAANPFRILAARQALGQINANGYEVVWADRLSHQGGLSGTATGAQTTNLPTAALTRSTSGVGVMAAIEVYTVIGTTPTTVTGSYTNSAGVSGRTFKERALGGSGGPNSVGVLSVLPLQDGDVGVRSVESITNSGSSGTVGNYGVTLFKPYVPLIAISNGSYEWDALTALGALMPAIPAAACLFPIAIMSITSTTVATMGELLLAED